MTLIANDNCLPLLGQISFINALPVVLPIERGVVPLQARTVAAAPGTLNDWLRSRRIEVGAMSAFFYLECSTDLQLVEGLAISSTGAVSSVLLFSRDEPQRLHGCKIFVPKTSASSVNLMRVLLKENWKVEVQIEGYDVPDRRLIDEGGLLLFGDSALLSDSDLSASFCRLDLGLQWQELTGLPMVYGVWGAHKEFVKRHPGEFAHISESLCAARTCGLSALFSQVLAEAVSRTGLPTARLEQYYRRDLDYSWTPEHKQGLRLYEALCAKHGLLKSAQLAG